MKAIQAALLLLFLASNAAIAGEAEDRLSPLPCAEGKDKVFCEQARRDFPKWLPKARRGDYQAQRNVAFCLLTGCDGAVTVNRVEGCAWRMVILAGGSPQVDASDTGNLKQCRDQLTSEEHLALSGRIQTLLPQIRRSRLRAKIGVQKTVQSVQIRSWHAGCYARTRADCYILPLIQGAVRLPRNNLGGATLTTDRTEPAAVARLTARLLRSVNLITKRS